MAEVRTPIKGSIALLRRARRDSALRVLERIGIVRSALSVVPGIFQNDEVKERIEKIQSDLTDLYYCVHKHTL